MHHYEIILLWSINFQINLLYSRVQKKKLSIKHFFSKCEQIRRKLRIWFDLLKKTLMKKVRSCAVIDQE